MKKTRLLLIFAIGACAAFIFALMVNRQYLANLTSMIWRLRKPNIYSMEISVVDYIEVRKEWKWLVVVEGNKPINVETVSEPSNDSWFNKYNFTIDGVFEAGEDFCFAIPDCSIEFDPIYFYPKALIYESRGVFIDNFQACNSASECLIDK